MPTFLESVLESPEVATWFLRIDARKIEKAKVQIRSLKFVLESPEARGMVFKNGYQKSRSKGKVQVPSPKSGLESPEVRSVEFRNDIQIIEIESKSSSTWSEKVS